MNGAQAEAFIKQKELEEARGNDERKKTQEAQKKELPNEKSGLNKAKKMAGSVKDAFSIASQIKPSDLVYAFALMAALFKDFLDFLQATGVFYFFVLVFALLIYIFIFFMILLGGILGGEEIGQIIGIHKQLTIFGGCITEMLFGINFLPITTASVFLLYYMTLVSRKEAKGKQPT